MSIDHRLRPRRRRLLALSLALASGALITGCDSPTVALEDAVGSGPEVEDEPAAALQDAVSAIGDWEGIEAALRVEVDDTVRAEVTSAPSVDEAEMLPGWSIVVRADGLHEPREGDFETSVVVDDASVLDLQVTSDDRVLLRFDLEALSELSDETDLGDLDDLVVAARGLGLGEVARATAEGGWIELVGVKHLRDLAAPEQAEEPEDDAERPGARDVRVGTSLEQFVDQAGGVSYIGSEAIGERVRLTTDGASVESLFDDLTIEFDRAGLLRESGLGDLDDFDIDGDRVVSMDAWIDDGELRHLALDLDSLDEGEALPGAALVLISLHEFTGSITEPDDAEPFDILDLHGSLSGNDTDGEAFAEIDEELLGDDDDQACITQDELDLIEEFEGQDELAELEQLFAAGVLERC